MANCVTCKARCENAGQHRVKTDCISYIPKDCPKPQTNADRIHAMTDEELAEWVKLIVCKYRSCGNCPMSDWCTTGRGIEE